MDNYNIVKIIEKKSLGQELKKEELFYVVDSYMSKAITDYQMSSLLMAIKIKGMTDEETINYTEALINSGEVIDSNGSVWVDKHSTGGIGDKTSIVLGPVLAACGCKIAKLSGRALGFTGGTLDKLESLKGFNVNLTKEEFIKQVNKIGVALISPLEGLVPADKKIYSLRDVTGSVSSVPLIAASVMAKKIASGSKYILIDLKVGKGAFIEKMADAKQLGDLMKKIGKAFQREVFILISSMSQPLGNAIGNGIEVKEAIDTLNNKGPSDLKELVVKIASQLISKSQKISISAAVKKVNDSFSSGKAYGKFVEWMSAQGTNKQVIELKSYFKPYYKTVLKASKKGYVKIVHPENFGWILIELGAGRKELKDKIDHAIGFKLKVKNGSKVEKYDTMIEVFSNRELTEDNLDAINLLFEISPIKPKVEKLILGEIKW